MNDAKLAEILYSIGHEVFAEYYRELSDLSLSRADLIERLRTDSRNAGKGRGRRGITRGTCGSKVSHGRRIIRARPRGGRAHTDCRLDKRQGQGLRAGPVRAMEE